MDIYVHAIKIWPLPLNKSAFLKSAVAGTNK